MANMAYVRFENTYRDLQDCYNHMDDSKPLSESERKYKGFLIELCCNIAEEYANDESVGGDKK